MRSLKNINIYINSLLLVRAPIHVATQVVTVQATLQRSLERQIQFVRTAIGQQFTGANCQEITFLLQFDTLDDHICRRLFFDATAETG